MRSANTVYNIWEKVLVSGWNSNQATLALLLGEQLAHVSSTMDTHFSGLPKEWFKYHEIPQNQ